MKPLQNNNLVILKTGRKLVFKHHPRLGRLRFMRRLFVPTQNLNMLHIDVAHFYDIGKAMGQLESIRPDKKLTAVELSNISQAAYCLDLLCKSGDQAVKLNASIRRTEELKKEIEALDELAKTTGKVSADAWGTVGGLIAMFEDIFSEETRLLPTYLIAPKRNYSIQSLISNAENEFPTAILSHLSKQVVRDIRDAGRCIAFECGTAAGIHSYRALEATAFDYLATRNLTIPKKDLYLCFDMLEKDGADKKVIQIGQQLRLLRRNPLAHPSENLDVDEAMGIRAIERFTRLNRRTVLGILETAGRKCAYLLETKIQDLKVKQVQIDELFSFVNCKPQNTTRDDEERGDFYTYLSVDRDSKLIINWLTDKRHMGSTYSFMRDLKRRLADRVQLTSDGFSGYCQNGGAVKNIFGNDVDYATETKVFGRHNFNPSKWRNPLTVIGIKRKARIGNPDMDVATTCHAERTNLSVRTFTRRFTRCTIGYSKKVENLRHAVALFIAHFNFCRVHSAHSKTPAQAAGLTEKTWTIAELLTASN